MESFNNVFEASETFHLFYRDILEDNLALLKNSNEQQITLLSLNYAICLNPYEEFKDINFDFNNFYEENENL